MAKITITLTEDFEGSAALLEFAAKLHAAFAIPAETMQRVIGAAINSNPAPSGVASAAAAVNPPASKVSRSAGESNSNPSASPPMHVSAGAHPAESPDVEGIPSPAAPSLPRDGAELPQALVAPAAGEPPSDAKPRAKRGRKSNAEKAAEASAAGDTGFEPVEPPKPSPHPLAAAIDAGAGEADETTKFLTMITEHVAEHGGGEMMRLLPTCLGDDGQPCKKVRDVPPAKRAEFLRRLKSTAENKQAA